MSLLAQTLATGAAFLVVAATPGPANLACATVSMARGRAAGMRFAAGLGLGLMTWGLVAASGLGAVMAASIVALTVLKVLGALYLFWLAFQSARSARRGAVSAPKGPAPSGSRLFWQGLILNLSNPKAVFAWLAALSIGADAAGGALGLALGLGVCAALGFLNTFGHALIFSTNRAMAGYARARRWIEGAASAFFALAGVGLLKSALSR